MKNIRSRNTRVALQLIVPVSFLLIATPATAQGRRISRASSGPEELPARTNGADCLFIGHSFFVPVAKTFDKIATQNGFISHHVDFVFAPGSSGAPGALWNSPRRRKQIEDKLATGKFDLLGMTAGVSRNPLRDYQRWIDAALKYNPDMRFLIGQCWVPGGPKMSTEVFDAAIEAAGSRQFGMVEKLRENYPQTPIYFINYGKTASLLKKKFEAGQLTDVDQMVGRNQQSLFRDGSIGHGGPMMLELCSLCWLEILYGGDIRSIERTPYNEADVLEVTALVLRFNDKFDNHASINE